MASGENGYLTPPFGAGRATFVVRCPTAAVRDLVKALFADLPDGDPGATPTLIVIAEGDEGHWSVQVGDGRSTNAQQINGALAAAVTGVSRLALDSDPDRLHLHCAALSLEGRGVLISADPGTGKTTLAAALAGRKWTYTSDEMIALSIDSPTATGFAKPLMIKPGGGQLVPELADFRVSLNPDDDRWWHIPASAIPVPIAAEVEPVVVVILEIRPNQSFYDPPVPVPLHPADAVVSLMGQTMDAERFGPETVYVLAQLAGRSRCVSLPVAPLADSTELIEQFARERSEPLEVRRLPSHREPVDGWLVPDTVRSVAIGDRAVVHDTDDGAIVALDEAGTGVWWALHGLAPDWWPLDALTSPGTISFLEQLSSHGLIARAPVGEPTGE